MSFVSGDVLGFRKLQEMTTEEYYSLLVAKLAYIEDVKKAQK
jgi:hypothetical protein